MYWFRDTLTLASQAAFYAWRLAGNRYEASVKMKDGFTVVLRPNPFQDMAIATEVFATEVFATEVYKVPEHIRTETASADSVNLVVDLGANVGYSCIYWLANFPSAKVVAFEPHPAHVKQIKKHLEANHAENRVRLIPKAAGIQDGELYLTDQEFLSELAQTPSANSIVVEVVDCFMEIGSERIDLLKMDIEGSEYTLLSDERFGQLNVRICVLEWHNTEKYRDGRLWCQERLSQLGYQVCVGELDNSANGLLWAWKKQGIRLLHRAVLLQF